MLFFMKFEREEKKEYLLLKESVPVISEAKRIQNTYKKMIAMAAKKY